MWLEKEHGKTEHVGRYHGMVRLRRSTNRRHQDVAVAEGGVWAKDKEAMAWLGQNTI